ncbi:hypothetical protein HMI55_005993 [Coelomomyces lativittatus]|nr:hypothetical protein HMI55_005993 [Coelomomyces lativittatus]
MASSSRPMIRSRRHSAPSTSLSGGTSHYVCVVCEKEFARAFNLKSHMKTHTDERPYLCPMCQKGFARKHDCVRHMRVHTKERPYRCLGCQKSFARHDALARHVRVDTSCICHQQHQHQQHLLHLDRGGGRIDTEGCMQNIVFELEREGEVKERDHVDRSGRVDHIKKRETELDSHREVPFFLQGKEEKWGVAGSSSSSQDPFSLHPLNKENHPLEPWKAKKDPEMLACLFPPDLPNSSSSSSSTSSFLPPSTSMPLGTSFQPQPFQDPNLSQVEPSLFLSPGFPSSLNPEKSDSMDPKNSLPSSKTEPAAVSSSISFFPSSETHVNMHMDMDMDMDIDIDLLDPSSSCSSLVNNEPSNGPWPGTWFLRHGSHVFKPAGSLLGDSMEEKGEGGGGEGGGGGGGVGESGGGGGGLSLLQMRPPETRDACAHVTQRPPPKKRNGCVVSSASRVSSSSPSLLRSSPPPPPPQCTYTSHHVRLHSSV